MKPPVIGNMTFNKENTSQMRNELIDLMRQCQVNARFDWATILSIACLFITETIEQLDE